MEVKDPPPTAGPGGARVPTSPADSWLTPPSRMPLQATPGVVGSIFENWISELGNFQTHWKVVSNNKDLPQRIESTMAYDFPFWKTKSTRNIKDEGCHASISERQWWGLIAQPIISTLEKLHLGDLSFGQDSFLTKIRRVRAARM